jgi:EmrB/QacA subfamily drug resistance transporter
MADGRRWWALIAMAASVLVVGLDLTVLNLALPTIATQLHASTGDLQWFSDSYSLVLAAAILPAGRLGDRYGRKKVLLIALALFGVSSVLCSYAVNTGELIAARAVLGIGAAAIFPMSLSVIPVLFRPEERQRAIALMASATFISFPIGPIVGGYLLDHFWWGSVFLINVPVVVLALAAVAFLLPESRSEHRPGIDGIGVVLSSAGLTGLTYGFIQAGQNGWGDTSAIAAIGAGVVALVVFVAWERRVRSGQPLIELALFRSAGFTWGTLLILMVTFAMFGLFFAMPQYFQGVLGVNAMGSGLRLLPMVGGMLVGMIGGTRLASPRGTRPPLVSAKALVSAGFLIMAAGLGLGATMSVSSGTGFASAWIAIAGLGLGLAMPQAMNAALGALSAERSGSGSALISAMRQVGATIGVAVLGTVLSSGYHAGLGGALNGLPAALATAAKGSVAAGAGVAQAVHSAALLGNVRVAFVHGTDIMLWVCGGIALASAILALLFLPRRAGSAEGPGPQVGAGESGVERAGLPL